MMIIATFKNNGKKYLLTSIIKDEEHFVCGRACGATVWFGKKSYTFEKVRKM